MDLAIRADPRVRLKESEKRNKYLDLARELKKTMELENDSDTNSNCGTWISHQRFGTRTGNKRTGRDHPSYNIIKTSQNNEKGPRDLRRLAFTQTLVINNRLMLV